MRTTIDLPDELFRELKVRAARSGLTLRELVRRYIELGLRQPGIPPASAVTRRTLPPVLVPPRGTTIPAPSRAELRQLEEEEDEARHARSARR